MKVPEGDFRNWDAIGAWADALGSEMVAHSTRPLAVALS